jgi:methylglutaconyl-CoA hydratase
MSQSSVLIDSTDPVVAIVTLNRPSKRNALSLQLMEELLSAVQAAAENVNRRVLLLRANGPAFCAGLDLKEAANRANTESSARALAAVYKAIVACPLVTIAAAQGAVIGGGVGLLSACDLVVAADDMQIGFPEVKRGLVAALVTALVRRQVNDRIIRELVLLGRTITATQALSIGLVNQVVEFERLTVAAQDLIAQALQSAPLAVARTKKLLDALSPRPMADELDLALRYHLEARDDAEAIEGIAAFLEKREPRWPPRPGQ